MYKRQIEYSINGTTVSGYLYAAFTPDQLEDYKENGNGFVTYAKMCIRDSFRIARNYKIVKCEIME